MKSSVLRAVALASSVSIGVFLVVRASSGCSSDTTQGVAQPETPTGPPLASGEQGPSAAPAAAKTEERFFQGSKAPGGDGLRPPAPAASSAQADEEFMGTSKSGRLIRKPASQPNAPNPPEPQK